MEEKKKAPKGLKIVLGMALGVGAFGSILGLESNIQPFNNVKIQDSSFRTYLEQGKRQYSEGVGTYALVLWTYPGAKVGAVINNYVLPDNSKR